MELELKHLAPYLPYKLKCQVTDKRKKKIATLGGLYNDGNCVFHDTIESEKGFKRIKPLLLPMSSLYTEMEDGKVPIVELAKMAGCNINMIKLPINEIETINIAKNNEVEFKYSSGYHRYFIFRNGSFYYKTGHDRRYGQDYETLKQSSQIELFTYLFEHHFDVFSLIDKGLALDKTKIK